jgi:hypothetical protein
MTEPRRIEPVVFLQGMTEKAVQPTEGASFHDYYRREIRVDEIPPGDPRLAFREHRQGATAVVEEKQPEHPALYPDSDIPEV